MADAPAFWFDNGDQLDPLAIVHYQLAKSAMRLDVPESNTYPSLLEDS
jgi:hypothetical protein